MSGYLRCLPVLLCLWVVFSAQAYEVRSVMDGSGREIFRLRFFDKDEGPFADPLPQVDYSCCTLPDAYKQKIVDSVAYWAQILQTRSGLSPAVINVGTLTFDNAAGFSPSATNDAGFDVTALNIQLNTRNVPSEVLSAGAHALFAIGNMSWEAPEVLPPPSVIPLTGATDLQVIAFHELAHGLGIASSIEDKDGSNTPYFAGKLGLWDSFLRDGNGNAPRAGQMVLCNGCNAGSSDPNAFDATDEAYFVGPHVRDVLGGALPGVPVSMYALSADGLTQYVDDNYMSHLELKNSLMSHQQFRNYTVFMEAELAVLQDLGYHIDRRKFYGHSVYGNDLTLVNNNGYFERNAAGTAYLIGQYSTAERGIGLHVYGSRNTIVQAADILTRGAGAAGIRVDGEANTIIVAPDVQVHSNGYYGQGIMFAYGKNHHLVQRGDVQALGTGGVGLRFDFGTNVMGNDDSYKGSYLFTVNGVPLALPDELNGPLVSQADITGRVAGGRAAIYLSETGLVGRINVMRGAQLSGDILSDYQQMVDGHYRWTTLSFGLQPDAGGVATAAADSSFHVRYDGNIVGKNFQLSLDGGYTSLNGDHTVHSVSVKPGATLGGNSTYTLDGGLFSNDGTVSPGNSPGTITINGDYVQSSSGTLFVQVGSDGTQDLLDVKGDATLGGTLKVGLLPGWYNSTLHRSGVTFVQASGALAGSFASVTGQSGSPTLSISPTSEGGGTVGFTVQRPANAYAQWARSANGFAIGTALDTIASGLSVGQGSAAMQSLFGGLDFSGVDGVGVSQALEQLSPAAYSVPAAVMLRREADLSEALRLRAWDSNRAFEQGAPDRYLSAYGQRSGQDSSGSVVGHDVEEYGVVAGGRRRLPRAPALSAGWQIDLARQRVSTDAPWRARYRSLVAGVGAYMAWQPQRYNGPMAFGSLHVGLGQVEFDHRIGVGSYQSVNQSDWIGYSGSASLGAAYAWPLSDTVSVGPLTALSYARMARPGVTESGDNGSRLRVDAQSAQALTSSLGLQITVRDGKHKAGSALTASGQVSWDHEWFDRHLDTGARFVGRPEVMFSSRNTVRSVDAMALRTGLTYQHRGLQLGLSVAGRFFAQGYRSVTGNVSLRWRF